MKRRSFLEKAIKYTSIGGLSLLTLFGVFPELLKKKKSLRKVILGTPAKVFAQGKVITKRIENETIIVLQKEMGVIEAYSAKCTHAGCLVEWHESQHSFLCKCHGGVFNEKGDPIAGPPKKSLEQFQIDIRKESNEIILYLNDASA